MDIANRIGINARTQDMASGPSGPTFAVELTGLTNNSTHGICAERGALLTAQVTGLDGAAPAPSYQWTLDGAPIAGATSASYTPDASAPALGALSCAVTVDGTQRNAAPAVLRDVPPATQNSLYDEIFDVESGDQPVASAAAFTGENLSFAVSGAGASIDAQTGVVLVPTDVEVTGAVVTVSASNSGGTATAAFQVTVEDISFEDALPFGALTPAGAGGVPVPGSTIVSGNSQGHWEIAAGHLVPSAVGEGALSGVYTLEFDSGDTLEVIIEAGKASARPEEVALVFNTLPLTARGLLVQDGDGRGAGRQRLEPKVFASECVIEPTNWIEDADPRQSVRPVTLAGLTIGGDPSGDGIVRMENLTVQGFICQMVQSATEIESNNGIILVERPSRHVVIRQNEVWSRDLREIIVADDFRDNLNTSGQLRGIATKFYSGVNEHIRIEENWVHDVSRGIIMTSTNAYQGVRSRLCGNYIEDVYTNFFTCGYLDGLDIFDNRCMHVAASLRDTLGAYPQTSPHASTGGSFDAGGARSTQNITMMGNLLHVGWHRTAIHEELGIPNITSAATGVKFNDPTAPDSYWNIVVAFNVVVSHNISMEISGGSASNHIEVFNNTLASEHYASGSSGPIFYFAGVSNLRLWNNIGTGYNIGAEDDSGFMVRTLDTMEAYGNVHINTGSQNHFGEVSYFVGDPVKGLHQLTIDEALTAYTPKPGTSAVLSEQMKGAIGTGLYLGNGQHSVTYDPPQPVGGVAAPMPITLWDGNAYLERSDALLGLQSGASYKSFLFAWEGEPAAGTEDDEFSLFSYARQYFNIQRLPSGGLQVYLRNADTGPFLKVRTSFRIDPGEGMSRIAVSYDVDTGRFHLVRNGVFDPYPKVTLMEQAEKAHFGSRPIRGHADPLGGNRFQGRFGRMYFDPRLSFFDLESDAGLSALYAQDGSFRDWGADGAGVTGDIPRVYVFGTASSLRNRAAGGAFTLNGGLIDE